MTIVDEPTTNRPPIWFEGDVPPEEVPEKYRLGRAFIPKARYLDPDFLDLELGRMFPRTWQIACRAEELADVGSFVEYAVGDFSVLVVRESKTAIRAYHNSCRHRGTRLARGRGRVGSLICPFHGWRWNLDGSIRLVLDREEFVPRSDEDLGLAQVRVDQWAGFVFINPDPDAIPLLEYLDPIPRIFEPFQLQNFRLRWGKSVVLDTNWKTGLDAFLEAYHVAGTHPQLFRLDRTNDKLASLRELDIRPWAPTTVYERHSHYSALGPKSTSSKNDGKDPSKRSGDQISDARLNVANAVQYLHEDMRGLENERSWRAAEALKTADVPEGMTAGKYFLQLYRELSIEEGYDWPVIPPEQWTEAGSSWAVFPNSIILPGQGSAFWYRSRPYEKDPNKCVFEVFSLDQIPIADYDKKRRFEPSHFDDYRDADMGQVFGQDFMNMTEVTAGMHSPSFDGHRLSEEQEMTIWNHHRVSDRYIWRD
ncbi:aromatic ring-hydroxylating oxygenase subunit alpha [Gordonia sp. DT218]|uniref:aromatic ring-hydroxylating oxygenase subunit alpha n=1 Tax=Gordonia sp. DT218 TaxID=3416659 RepID=UPI003CEBB326